MSRLGFASMFRATIAIAKFSASVHGNHGALTSELCFKTTMDRDWRWLSPRVRHSGAPYAIMGPFGRTAGDGFQNTILKMLSLNLAMRALRRVQAWLR